MAASLSKVHRFATTRALLATPLGIFTASILSTCLFWLVKPPTFLHVTAANYARLNMDYFGQVQVLIAGHGTFSVRYPPGFPLLLGAIYKGAISLHLPLAACLGVFVLACTASGSVLLFLLARHIWGKDLALVAPLAWMTYIAALWLTTYASPETPFMVFLFGGVLVVWRGVTGGRPRGYLVFMGGALIGVAMLIRPIALFLGVLLPALLWFIARGTKRRVRLRLMLLMFVGTVAAVAPWEVWAHHQTGRVILLSSGGVPSILDGLTYAVDPTEMRNAHIPDNVAALQRDMYARQMKELHSVGTIAAYLVTQLRRRPAAVVELFAIKAADSWYATDSTRYDWLFLLVQAIYLPLVALGTWHTWKRGGRARDMAMVTSAIGVCFWCMTIMVLSIARYMTPAVGLLFVTLPGTLPALQRVWRRSRAILGMHYEYSTVSTISHE